MTKAQLLERLEEIRQNDLEGKHFLAISKERKLWEDLLRAIAMGEAEDPRTMARMCLAWYSG